jgi:hypothetical protein
MIEQSTIDWFKRKSARIAPTSPPGSQAEKDLIAAWRRRKPQMAAELERAGVLAEAAHVLNETMLDSLNQNLNAGMNPADAREQAEADWLMMEEN